MISCVIYFDYADDYLRQSSKGRRVIQLVEVHVVGPHIGQIAMFISSDDLVIKHDFLVRVSL